MLRSLTALLTNLVDYAGLYPPAKLGMSAAVDNYATYLRSEESWMLGRFICPVSRLEEFRREARGLLPTVEPASDTADDLLPVQCVQAGRDARLSHDNLFHSVLGLLDVQTRAYRPELDLSASCRAHDGQRLVRTTPGAP